MTWAAPLSRVLEDRTKESLFLECSTARKGNRSREERGHQRQGGQIEKMSTTHLIGISKEAEMNVKEAIVEEIMNGNFLELMKYIDS